MNYGYLFLICAISGSLLALQGDITFNNNLAQPIQYTYHTKVTQSVGGLKLREGASVPVSGRGNVSANTKNYTIPSRLKVGKQNTWGDSIDFTLSRNPNDSQTFTVNQLGAYTIDVDANNKLTLTKN